MLSLNAASCVSLGKLLNLSGLLYAHDGGNPSTSLTHGAGVRTKSDNAAVGNVTWEASMLFLDPPPPAPCPPLVFDIRLYYGWIATLQMLCSCNLHLS